MRYAAVTLALQATLATVFLTPLASAQDADAGKYPDWAGKWERFAVRGLGGQPSHDQTKPWGFGQQAPLTPEYAAVLEESLADQAKGGLGNFPTTLGRPAGMPNMMMAFGPLEFVVTPETTYVLIGWHDHFRRIYTDGREWAAEITPTFSGYSIGKWIDTDGDGRYDLLEVETRGFKGPRTFEGSGLPLHHDGESVIKERIYLDKADKNLLHDEVTVIDHALTRPWTVIRHYQRDPDGVWDFVDCAENNPHVVIGSETYMMSADGYLMPTKPDQPAPDLRYFKRTKK
jgi:hypothetical protein